MMACYCTLSSLSLLPFLSKPSSSASIPFLSPPPLPRSLLSSNTRNPSLRLPSHSFHLNPSSQLLCRTAAEYVFPDPIPEFAESETNKFRTHLLGRLSKKDMFGDSVEEVVRVCSEILSNFLHTEYGGPGTLLVIPFIDMADTLNERGLPGGPQAARAAVVWAQKHVDKDWNEWTEGSNEQK